MFVTGASCLSLGSVVVRIGCGCVEETSVAGRDGPWLSCFASLGRADDCWVLVRKYQ